jgi:hypothetical protein
MEPEETNQPEDRFAPPQQSFTPVDPDTSADDGMTEQEASVRPETDSQLDTTEVLNEGVAGAAEIEEPNQGDAVTDYNPDAAGDPADETDTTHDESV